MLVKDPQDSDAKIETNEQWTDLIDREGLWHVKQTTYLFSCSRACHQRCFNDNLKSFIATETRND